MSRYWAWPGAHTGGARRLALSLLLCSLLAGCTQTERWNVLIVTFDTTRADHIGSYGNTEARTPVLDQLASEAVLFEHAITPVPITLPAHSSLMTGKVPFAHGVRDNGLFVLGQDQLTLAEILQQAGYRTAAAIGSFPLMSRFGISQGFELFDERIAVDFENIYGERVFPKQRLFFDERRAARVNEAVLPWLEAHHQEPFFLWLHYFDPHHPHEPPAPYNQMFVHDLYAGEIAYADESLGTLLDHLKRLGVYDRTLIVFTADHGEGNGEHRESTHSLLMYNSTLHVPLMIRTPGGASHRVSQWVSLVDVLPTVLDILDISPPEDIQGVSLKPYLSGPPAEDDAGPPRYAETLSPRLSRGWGELRGLLDGHHKYIHGPRPELYDLAQDPHELDNLIEHQPALAADLREQLQGYLEAFAVPELDSSVYVDEDTLRRLRGLGYLQASTTPVGVIEERLRNDGVPPQDYVDTINAYSMAKNLVFQGRLLEAERILTALRKGDTDNAAYLELLIQTYIKLGRHGKALDLLGNISLASGTLPPQKILDLMGSILLAQGKLAEAIVKFQDAQIIESSAAGQHRLAQLYQLLGQTAQQQQHLQRALQQDPRFVPARLDNAILSAQQGLRQQAEKEFQQALTDHPYYERTFYNYGAYLLETGQATQALDYFQRALELQPAYHKARYALIETLLRLDRPEQARHQLERLLQMAGTSPEADLARQLFTTQ